MNLLIPFGSCLILLQFPRPNKQDVGLLLKQTALLYSTWTLVEVEHVGGYHRQFPFVSVHNVHL